MVFDVTSNVKAYGPGAGYSVLVGKDCSRALGKSSLKPEDLNDDISDLSPKQLKVLDDWLAFFTAR